MAYITESRISDVLDLPVAIPATEVRMGDWVIAATIRIEEPMTLTYRFCNFYLMACTVETVPTANKIYPNLGMAYVVLRKDYSSGSPGVGNALDSIVATSLGMFSRDPTSPLVIADPGYYSWIVVNNTQPSQATGAVSSSTSIDMRMSMTGQVRLTVFPQES